MTKIDFKNIDLPVLEVLPKVQESLFSKNTLILQAPPGAGKSTLLPLALLNEPWLNNQKILMLEPRKLAARSIAHRMAELLGEEVGNTVGYRVRFESKTSSQTKIEVVTEGILTRILQNDNALEGIGLVIFDEFHERSIHADIAMALSRECQEILRPDMRMLIMSATLDMNELSEKLQAPVIQSQGRQYPVDIIYGNDTDKFSIVQATTQTILKAIKKHDGDVLVFLPGQGEIRRCEEFLNNSLSQCTIHALYGKLSQQKQQEAIYPNKNGQRKIVLATSIAETSLTIEGIKIVIDSGYTKKSIFNPNSGLSKLETVQISKDSADQRAGRAGRLSPGVCYRLWSKVTQSRLSEHRTPEISEADLAPLVLDLAFWGINDVNQLTWLTSPPRGPLAQASDVLHRIGALQDNKITAYGKEIHQVPSHPRIAHMLLCADSQKNLQLATDLAVILEERDPLPQEVGIDINLRVEALRRFRKGRDSNLRFKYIEKIARSYRELMNVSANNDDVDIYASGFLLAQVYTERIARHRGTDNSQFQLANGKNASVSNHDNLANEPWLAVASIDGKDGIGKIYLASPLNPDDLKPFTIEQDLITWDTKKGGLIAVKERRIGNIILSSSPFPQPNHTQIGNAITDAVQKEGLKLLDFNKNVEQLQFRISGIRKWLKDDTWPDVSTTALLDTCKTWLTPYINEINKPEDLKKLNLFDIILHSLPYEKQVLLDDLAPSQIKVPSGSSLQLVYQANYSQPVLAVRIQEIFGMPNSPVICRGQLTVLLHLLSPGYKPVQITSDLNNFWKDTYFDVKKDLKGRYPKHSWPEDPANAEAVRGVKKRSN